MLWPARWLYLPVLHLSCFITSLPFIRIIKGKRVSTEGAFRRVASCSERVHGGTNDFLGASFLKFWKLTLRWMFEVVLNPPHNFDISHFLKKKEKKKKLKSGLQWNTYNGSEWGQSINVKMLCFNSIDTNGTNIHVYMILVWKKNYITKLVYYILQLCWHGNPLPKTLKQP